MRLVKLLKRPGQGIGARLGSSSRGSTVRQVHKNAPKDMDGELTPGVCYIVWGVCMWGVCDCVGCVLVACVLVWGVCLSGVCLCEVCACVGCVLV